MFAHTLFAAALAASSAFAAALPAKPAQQAVAAVAPIEKASSLFYKTISPDGSCGGKTGYTCEGSSFGDCCGASGFWYVITMLHINSLILTNIFQRFNASLLRRKLLLSSRTLRC